MQQRIERIFGKFMSEWFKNDRKISIRNMKMGWNKLSRISSNFNVHVLEWDF